MAEKSTITLKRTRVSTSSSSDSETRSPDRKRIYISSFNTTLSENDTSGGSLDDSGDQVLKALTMTNKIGQQLQQILDRLESMEIKLQTMEGVLSQIFNLEKAVNKIQVSIVSFNEKVKKMDETIKDLDAGLTSLNADIEEMQNSEKQDLGKIKELQDQILYQDKRELTNLWPPTNRSHHVPCVLSTVLRTQGTWYTSFLSVNWS